MKRLTIILTLLLSFGFSQIMMPDASKMSDTEKMMWYQNEKKSPALALAYSFLLPSAGHAYAGDWARGLKFKVLEIGLFFGSFSVARINSREIPSSDVNCYRNCTEIESDEFFVNIAVIMFLSAPIIWVWELIDVAKTAKKYNTQLYKNLFGTPPLYAIQFNSTAKRHWFGIEL